MNGCIVSVFGLALYYFTGCFVFMLAINAFGGGLRFLFCVLMATPLLLSGAVVTQAHIRRHYRPDPYSGFSTLAITIPASTLVTVLIYSPVFLQMDGARGGIFAGSLAVAAIVAGFLHLVYVDLIRATVGKPDETA